MNYLKAENLAKISINNVNALPDLKLFHEVWF